MGQAEIGEVLDVGFVDVTRTTMGTEPGGYFNPQSNSVRQLVTKKTASISQSLSPLDIRVSIVSSLRVFND